MIKVLVSVWVSSDGTIVFFNERPRWYYNKKNMAYPIIYHTID